MRLSIKNHVHRKHINIPNTGGNQVSWNWRMQGLWINLFDLVLFAPHHCPVPHQNTYLKNVFVIAKAIAVYVTAFCGNNGKDTRIV